MPETMHEPMESIHYAFIRKESWRVAPRYHVGHVDLVVNRAHSFLCLGTITSGIPRASLCDRHTGEKDAQQQRHPPHSAPQSLPGGQTAEMLSQAKWPYKYSSTKGKPI